MLLDYRTVVATEVCLLLTVGGLLLFMALKERKVRGLVRWGAAYLTLGGSIILLIVGEAAKLLWLIHTGWSIYIVAVAMMWSAARQFDGRPVRLGWVYVGALTMILIKLMPGYPSSPNLSFTITALLTGAFFVAAAFEIWRGREEPLISRWPVIVLLVLSAAVPVARALMILVAPIGLSEYTLTSGWLAVSLLASLLCETAIALLVIAMAKERQELHHKKAARIDPLTGLCNRREFTSVSRRWLRRSCRDRTPAAILMFDLDQFKRVNDRFGHAIGDRVLQLFAAAVRQTLRPTDIVARIGGEEFAALVLVVDTADAIAIAERMRVAFATAARDVDDLLVAATVSVGVAIAQHGDEDFPKLLGRADEALYRAKGRGRNRVEIATESRPHLAA